MSRWDRRPWLVERICTCTSKNAECHRDGYHAVDGHETREAAEDDARALLADVKVPYRVTEARTGTVVWAGRYIESVHGIPLCGVTRAGGPES